MTDCFFLVWNSRGRNPQYRHGTEGEAKREARRLARQNPGQTFVVLKAIGHAHMALNVWTRYVDDDEIPF